MRRLLYDSCRFGIAIIMAIIFIYIPIVNAQAATIYVPDDYPTIQQAVEAALPGDTIIVKDGTYVENIFVLTPNLTIKSESGPENCIVQSPDKWFSVFVVGVNYTTISGFTIENGSAGMSAGITFEPEASHCNVSNNHITRNSIGIDIWVNSTDNSITFNRIYENEIGMRLFSSHDNFIYLNDFFNNTWNIDSWDSINIWNSPEPVSYIYNGNEYANYLGNCWDDYTGMDADGDGIGDEPYLFSEWDDFPLIAPFENYQIYGVAPPFIKIIGNNEFTPENRVSGGSGTESDPYIIEGLEIDAKGGEYGIWIQDTDAYFIIRNCIIKNTTDYGEGIYFNNVTNGRVENNTVLNNYYGIYLYESSDNILINNTALDNSGGIYLAYSSNNILTNNNISNNSWRGIRLSDSSNNIITNNTVLNNRQGIRLIDSIHNSIINNTAKDNWEYDIGVSPFELDTACDNIVENNIGSGDRPIKYFNHSVNLQDEILSELVLCNADNSHISNVTIRGSEVVNNNGLTLVMTDNSTFENVYSYNNYYGIYLRDSTNNTIRDSVFLNNNHGIDLRSWTRLTENNRIYNNIFNNEKNYYTDAWYPFESATNIWNVAETPGTNILGGNYLGGNAWLHPNGTGFSQMCNDIDNDSICDSPYTLDMNNTDYLPLAGKIPLIVPDYYPEIQWAVDSATAGDTIIVRDGVYVENIVIDKPLTLKSLNGAKSTIIQAKDIHADVIKVIADYVNISGFTIRGGLSGAGIFLEDSDYCNISDNNITNNHNGIYLSSSSNNTITNSNVSSNNYNGIYLYYYSSNNTIANNTASNNYNGIYLYYYSSNNTIANNTASNNYNGIYLDSSCNNTLTSNNASNNYDYGIYLDSSCNNTLTSNNASNNYDYGIYLDSSCNNTLTSNNASNNYDYGIYLVSSSNNTITNSNVSSNNYNGIYLYYYSSNNTIANNNASDNRDGISLYYSSNNTLTGNNASNNYGGIYIYHSQDNFIYLNEFINNRNYNAYSMLSNNFWASPEPITYTYNGSQFTNFMGNYWSDYTGTDLDGDGIGDTSYSIISNEADYYPLMQPFEAYIRIPSTTEMTMNETTSTTHALYATIISQNATLNTTVAGDLNGSLNFTTLEFVLINSSSFAGKGFSKGNWTAIIEGTPYNGHWQGMIYKKSDEERIYLKGMVSGGLKGIVEGYLTESVNGSGVYDQYRATWTISHIGTHIVYAKVDLNGTINYRGSIEYSSELYALQTFIEGEASGYWNGSLNIVLTHVRIDNETNPYYGEGFSIISYVSEYGSGEGWTYNRLVSPNISEMYGLFTDPLVGTVSGTLDESKSSRTLSIAIERIDLGLPPMADLKVRVWGPERVSPGQSVNYIIEYRNDGLKAAESTRITAEFNPELKIISSSKGSFWGSVGWNLEKVKPKTKGFLHITAEIPWGLSPHSTIKAKAYISPIKNQLFEFPDCPRMESGNEEEILKVRCPLGGESPKERFTYWFCFSPQCENHIGERLIEGVSRTLIKQYPYVITYKNNCDGTCTIKYFCHKWTCKEKGDCFCEYANCYCQVIGESGNGDGALFCERTCYYTGNNRCEWGTRSWFDWSSYEWVRSSCKRETRELEYTFNCEPQDCDEPNPDENEHHSEVIVAGDPNIKYGPEGFVSPNQKLNYTVEFENEGEGIAFGVYFTDTLDEDLDDSTLEIGPVISTKNGSVIAPPGTYDPETRTITWFVGEVGPGEGGYANFSVNVKSDAEEGTEIINYATVYFPSVPEETRTNGIVSIVDVSPPRYSNVGQSKSEVNVSEDIEVYAYWQDGVQLNYTWLETNESGTWQNVSYRKQWNDKGWSNFSIRATQEGTICWRIHANDTAGNENVTQMFCFEVLPINEAPVANSNGPYQGIEGQPIQFNGSASYDPEGVPLTYYWDFGDGSSAVTDQQTITHIYAQQGNYTVTLIVNDSVQNSTPSITYALINDTEPKANFTANKTYGFAPLTVQFNDSSVSYDGIIAWEWDFDGDGIIDSNEQNPIYTYDEAGTYTVSLTVYEADGDSDTETKTDYITVTSAVDTEPPTIESVTLDTYINIPNSSFHVTVEATDNVGVTSVTADGVALVETGSVWEGNITAPSSTGESTLTIRAEDAAGNYNETTVDYSVVKPSGSIGIGVDPRLTTVNASDTAIINITLVSTENFDDIAYVYLTTEGVYPGYEANLTWFNWTSRYVKVPAGATVKVPLKVNIPIGESGYKVFYAKLESTKWTPTAMDTGVLYII